MPHIHRRNRYLLGRCGNSAIDLLYYLLVVVGGGYGV